MQKPLKFLNRSDDSVHQKLERVVILLINGPSGTTNTCCAYHNNGEWSMNDLASLHTEATTYYQVIKTTIILGLGLFFTLAFSACGFTNGNVTFGSTSYLEQANHGKILMSRDQYLREEAKQ